MLAAPIAGEGSGRSSSAPKANVSKIAYLQRIHELVRAPLLAGGFPNMNTHAHGSYLWLRWPDGFWLAPFSLRMDIRVTRSDAVVALVLTGFGSKAANARAGLVLREHFESDLAAVLSPGTETNWEASGSGSRKIIRFTRPGCGYAVGDAGKVADWAATTCADSSTFCERTLSISRR